MRKLLISSLFFVVACGVESDEGDGLTIFSSDADSGITGMFQQGDGVVFFETITTGVREDSVEGATVFEASARFADQDGRTIVAIHEGHVVDGWTQATSQRVADLVVAAADELEREGVGAGAGHHLELLLRLRQDAVEMATEQAAVPAGDVAYTTWQQRGKLFRRCMLGPNWLCAGAWHTGAKLYRYKNGSSVSSTTYCNHGSSGWCPGDTYMDKYCDKYGPTKSSESDLVGIGSQRKCQTGYTWSSIGGHNCNDDTRIQARAAINNKADDKYGGYCADGDMFSGYPPCGWF